MYYANVAAVVGGSEMTPTISVRQGLIDQTLAITRKPILLHAYCHFCKREFNFLPRSCPPLVRRSCSPFELSTVANILDLTSGSDSAVVQNRVNYHKRQKCFGSGTIIPDLAFQNIPDPVLNCSKNIFEILKFIYFSQQYSYY
jgi:hypothetical protein